MRRLNDRASNQHTGKQPATLVARSYREIAEVLTEREGIPITTAEVSELCRGAERKLAAAARTDPIIHQWLRTAHRQPI